MLRKLDGKWHSEFSALTRKWRTKPLDSAQSRLSWPDRLTLAAGVLVLLLFVSLIVAILANVIGAH